MRRYFESAAAILEETDYTFGCPVAPVILDAAAGVAELETLCREALDTWTRMLEEAFAAAGFPAGRASSLALLAITSVEGGLLLARASRTTDALRTVARESERVVADAESEAAFGATS